MVPIGLLWTCRTKEGLAVSFTRKFMCIDTKSAAARSRSSWSLHIGVTRLEEVAGWIAPVATMIAAMMTAANLGARFTGWGFVVFTFGSIAWSVIGLSSGQTNLLATNGFLTIVNLVGVWRWLGKQRAYEDGGKSAIQASRRSAYPTLFTATGIAGMPVNAVDGQPIGKAVEALVTCENGSVSYVVITSSGLAGIGEELRAVAHEDISFSCDSLTLRHGRAWFESLPPLAEGDWPAAPEQPQDTNA